MKKLCRLLLAVGVVVLLLGAAPINPTPEFFVNDYADVITQQDRDSIRAAAQALEEQTTAQVVVLTVESMDGDAIENYAYSVAEGWGIGQQGKDNGVLILLAVEERASRIEVGYGLEEHLTDILTGRIQDDYMLPHYRDGDYSQGLLSGFQAVAAAVYLAYEMEPPEGILPQELPQEEAEASGFGGIGIVVLVAFLFLLPKRRFWGRRRRGSGSMLGNMMLYQMMKDDDDDDDSPFFGGFGGGGGGGFGGGGGSFGGGGSSRNF